MVWLKIGYITFLSMLALIGIIIGIGSWNSNRLWKKYERERRENFTCSDCGKSMKQAKFLGKTYVQWRLYFNYKCNCGWEWSSMEPLVLDDYVDKMKVGG